MTHRAISMNHVSSRSVCTGDTAALLVYTNAACFFSVLRSCFYFYFTGSPSSKRQQIS